ncbi:BofC C-terminal domain-containing protein [Microaerobacter geothermalis]|nr:BofC C-terminal domain-containing protein [Microaerobacter geothermalis]
MWFLRKIFLKKYKRKSWITLGALFAGIIGIFLLGTLLLDDTMINFKGKNAAEKENIQAVEALGKQPIEVVYQIRYVCGVTDEIRETVLMDKLSQLDKEWELIRATDKEMVYLKQVDDLAPACKENGYMGLSEGGVLTLFLGPPADKKVIQTFYPLDTERLESSLPSEELKLLQSGIRVRNLAEYNSILSTYGAFAKS